MSEPDDVNLDLLKAPLPPRDSNGFEQLRFQLLGYATALAVLVTLTPTWLIREYSRDSLRIYSGFSMTRDAELLGSAANWLFIAYALLVLVALAMPTTVASFVCAYLGLADTIVIVLLKPDSSEYSEYGWTGAPVLAIGLWLVLGVLNTIGWYLKRRT
ncbi:hypothetical protein [Kribbella sp. NPDC004875]|uniref:hypothetical protein n=1 Tax=Kribbella sp. NPDC004875 TaxID=3364107 RepID=UPI0036C757BD